MMIYKKGDIINSFGTAIFVVLFMLIITSFSDKSIKPTDGGSQFELNSCFHSDQHKSVISEAVSLPSVQKRAILLLQYNFNDSYKVIANNKTINQVFIELKKMQFIIKPVCFYRFYYHLFSKDNDDLPVLS